MAMDIWRRDDIRNALQSAQLAHESFLAAGEDPIVLAYDAGFQKALRAIAANFGIQIDANGQAHDRLRQLLAPPARSNGSHS